MDGTTIASTFCLLHLVLVAAAPAAPEIRQETLVGPDGARWARTITLCDIPPADADIPPAAAGTRGVNQYIWIDRNHRSAIAEHVAITGLGAHGIAGWWLNGMRVSAYRVPGGAGDPEWEHPLPFAEFQIACDADFSGDRLATAARNESLLVFGAGSSDPIFTDWFAPPYVGMKCAVSDDDATLAFGGGDPSGLGGEIRVLDGATGALRFARPLPAPPEGVSVSGDGLLVAANIRGFAKVWVAATGALRDSVAIPGGTQTSAALSDNGFYLVTGGFSRTVRLYRWNGADYVQDWSHSIPSTTWVTALTISRDGTTIVAGTWTNPTGGRVVVYDRSSSTPLWTDASFGDEVHSVAVTPDGAKIAAASWGRSGGTVGNVVSVYERGSSIPLWTIGDDAIAGVGSCMSVDLSENGCFLLAGGKEVHAREFGGGGFVMAIDVSSPAAVDDLGGTQSFRAAPNPFRESLRIAGAGSLVSIWSADGRLIRTVRGPRRGERADGGWSAPALWDGRDEAGREAPAGVYFIWGAASGAAPIRVARIR
ncbi:MAG: WD40 repeat domain-containing protein [Candidatus Eisenbacteria bacterium]|nr:WD40 repeat domain-containing protein [Candidatus Eisenbacteria bacterium]